MRKYILIAICFVVSFQGVIESVKANQIAPKSPSKIQNLSSTIATPKIASKLANIHIPFIANDGQINRDVMFYAKTFSGTVFVTKDAEIVYDLPYNKNGETTASIFLREEFGDGHIKTIVGEEQAATRINVFRGNDPSLWKNHVPSYKSLSFGEIAEGIILRLKASGNNVEKLFTILPGANPEAIQVTLKGGEDVKVNEAGELEVRTKLGAVTFTKPIAYQKGINGRPKYIKVAYVVKNGAYGFKVGEYNTEQALVIDPLLSSTFLGGSADDTFFGSRTIALDGNGNVFLAGRTYSSSFPTSVGAYDTSYNGSGIYHDGFIAKFDAELSTLLASTFLGGSDWDNCNALVLDGDGTVYVAGYTNSDDFPVTTGDTHNGSYDVFVTTFTNDLTSLSSSRFLGGSSVEGLYSPISLALDESGNVYVAGSTNSSDFPTTTGAYQTFNKGNFDAFVAKLSNNLTTLSASTFLGGSLYDYSSALAIDTSGNIYVAGRTNSSSSTFIFPTTSGAYDESHNGSYDVFITKLSNSLTTLSASTFLGGNDSEADSYIILDTNEHIYITGETPSTDFPTTSGAYDESHNGDSDNYLAYITNDLTTLSASTFLGGSADDGTPYIALNADGDIYITGYTASSDFPVTSGVYDETYNENNDIFISKISANLQNLSISTFLGGAENEAGKAIVLDGEGNIYINGVTNSSDFPVLSGGADESYNGEYDVFLTKIDPDLSAQEEMDFGDAPSPYPTLLSEDGPRHASPAELWPTLGAYPDLEPDGQPTTSADGDDAACTVWEGCSDDDEDGLDTLLSEPLVPGSDTAFELYVNNGAGLLNAWIDFNGDGDWDDAGEQIFSDTPVAEFSNTLSFTVPADATLGITTYARFRVSTEAGLSYTGFAPDGEVEDYQVEIAALDFGDAPSPYPTLLSEDGPRHASPAELWPTLGIYPDLEPDGQPTTSADGDDAACTVWEGCSDDDEDGLDTLLSEPLVPGSDTAFELYVNNGAGLLNAWIDFNGDGDWDDAGEQIFSDAPVAEFSNTLSFTVPADATLGITTYARFRVSTESGLSYTGFAPDGEVEDYQVEIAALDFGDAPSPYPTLLSEDGPRHASPAELWPTLDIYPDLEPDGQPTTSADGDDAACTVWEGCSDDDEDGLDTLLSEPLVPGSDTAFELYVNNGAGLLNAWIDFNGDGDWDDAGEQIFSDAPVAEFSNTLSFTVPADATLGITTYARFRVSTEAGLSYTGFAPDGEVEDYQVEIAALDFGDAPSPYPTLLSEDGPRHASPAELWPTLGIYPDLEPDGQPTTSADGDDAACTVWEGCSDDDEDGLDSLLSEPLVPGSDTAFELYVNNGAGLLNAWIDFNGDGDWDDAGEQIFSDTPVAEFSNTLNFTVPADATLGITTYARFRVSTEAGLSYTGFAPDGEVEDYQVEIAALDFGDAPSPYPTLLSEDGPRHASPAELWPTLGIYPDLEPDGQPTTSADGDDAACTVWEGCSDDDEDSLDTLLSEPLVPGSDTAFELYVNNGAGLLNAWIDFNGDGDWDDAGEQIFSDTPVAEFSNTLSFTVPADATLGITTYARFRVSTEAGLSYTGFAPDGEVEDYQVEIAALDFGDAPSPYPTLLSEDGPRHASPAELWPTLGIYPDLEPDGQPTTSADGDDAACTVWEGCSDDDEDSLDTLLSEPLVPGSDTAFELYVNNGAGLLNAWIDFNGDGDWDDAGEQIFNDTPVAEFSNTLSFTVPADATLGITTYARFRVSTEAGLSYTGFAPNGEVEDYAVFIEEGPEITITQDASDILSGETHDFGTVQLGTSHAAIFNIYNAGSGILELTGSPFIEVDGEHSDDFVVNPQPTSPIAAGSQGTFTMTFSPGATGIRTAIVSIRSTDSDEDPYEFMVIGTGLSACIEPLAEGRHEEDDTSINFSSGWLQSSGIKYTNGLDEELSFCFSGAEFTLYRTLAANRGDMDVCVDGSCQTVSNTAASTQSNQPVTINGLSEETHTVTISKSADDGSYIDLDAVYIGALDSCGTLLAEGRHEEDDSDISFSSGWAQAGEIMYTNGASEEAAFCFSGAEFTLYRTLAANRGSMELCVDDSCQTISNYAAATQSSQPVTIDGLSEETHRVTIAKAVADSTYIDLDAVHIGLPSDSPACPGTLTAGSYENDDSGAIAYTSGWATAGSITYTNGAEEAAVFCFNDTEFTLSRTLAANRGRMEVCVDEVCETVDNSSASTQSAQPYSQSGLSAGEHTVVISKTDADSSYIDLDSLVIGSSNFVCTDPLSAGEYDHSAPEIAYSAGWAVSGNLSYTNGADEKANFCFVGRELTLYRTLAVNRGSMELCVDDVCETVDNYNATTLSGQAYTVSGLSLGQHTVSIRKSVADSSYIDLNAVKIVEDPCANSLGTGIYEEDAGGISYTAGWATGSGIRYTNASSDTASFCFSGAEVTIYRTMAANRGDMELCVDAVCETVSNTSGATLWRQPYTTSGLSSGEHILTIQKAAADSSYIDLDAVGIGMVETQAVEAVVVIRKAGTGQGAIQAGEQVCGVDCEELIFVYEEQDEITVQVSPDAGSIFVGWQAEDGGSIEELFYALPGDTVYAVFDVE